MRKRLQCRYCVPFCDKIRSEILPRVCNLGWASSAVLWVQVWRGGAAPSTPAAPALGVFTARKTRMPPKSGWHSKATWPPYRFGRMLLMFALGESACSPNASQRLMTLVNDRVAAYAASCAGFLNRSLLQVDDPHNTSRIQCA